MDLIIFLIMFVIFYVQGGSSISKNEKLLKEKGIEGVSSKVLLDKYRKAGLSDQ